MIEPPRPTPAPITIPPITPLAQELISDIEKLTHLLPNEELLRKVRAIPNEANAPERSSAADLVEAIAGTFSPSEVSDHKGNRQNLWVLIGLLYMSIKRISTSLAVFKRLYDHILIAQEETNTRYHKGVPLVWMSDCYDMLGYHATAQRHLMLTLVEDAIIEQGKLSFGLGIYYRLVWTGLLSESEWRRYGQDAYSNYESDQKKGFYPEWILQELDRDWIAQLPAPQEATVFSANQRYVRHLIHRLDDGTGKSLEALADYLVSCMPGCRAKKRVKSNSTDYDIICSVEGLETDFRSEFGRYFVCECKDLAKAASVTDLAKFCYVLDSVKSRFGVFFSKRGISGEGRGKNADREQVKVFQNRGIVIVVIDGNDLERLSKGDNFISLLRRKYEEVRLDLSTAQTPKNRSPKNANRSAAPSNKG